MGLGYCPRAAIGDAAAPPRAATSRRRVRSVIPPRTGISRNERISRSEAELYDHSHIHADLTEHVRNAGPQLLSTPASTTSFKIGKIGRSAITLADGRRRMLR